MTDLSAENITVDIGRRRILAGVSMRVAGHGLTGLIGPNGAGKTTLLRALVGLQRATGEVRLNGVSWRRLSRKERARAVAYLEQSNVVHWPVCAERLVALGRLPHLSPWDRPSRSDQAAVARAMVEAEVSDLAGRNVMTLSGGERARVLLARALAVEAPILLADEPVASLDPYHQLQVMELLRASARKGAAVLVVLHNLTLAGRFCDRLVLLRAGTVLADGPPSEVLTSGFIEHAYQVQTVAGSHRGQSYVLPWARLER